MQTLRDIAPYVALAGAALALVLLIVTLVLWSGVRKLRRAQTVVMGHHEQRDIVGHVESLDSQVRNLREAVEILTDELDGHKRHLDRALTNRAIIRYDAFRDAGGEQSASFALLDDYRSGVVMSTIAARDFSRIYVKHLKDGVADRDLSPEEEQVVALAVPRPLRPGEEGPRSARAPSLAGIQRPSASAAQPGSEALEDVAPPEPSDTAAPENAIAEAEAEGLSAEGPGFVVPEWDDSARAERPAPGSASTAEPAPGSEPGPASGSATAPEPSPGPAPATGPAPSPEASPASERAPGPEPSPRPEDTAELFTWEPPPERPRNGNE